MSLKFSFGGSSPEPHDHASPGIPLPFAGAASQPVSTSSVLDFKVSLNGDEAVCEALSGDGASYARATKRIAESSTAGLAAAVRSVLARTGAELPEPLLGSVTGVVLDLGGAEASVLGELGLAVSPGAAQLAAIDAALQARTGLTAGTPIRTV